MLLLVHTYDYDNAIDIHSPPYSLFGHRLVIEIDKKDGEPNGTGMFVYMPHALLSFSLWDEERNMTATTHPLIYVPLWRFYSFHLPTTGNRWKPTHSLGLHGKDSAERC